MDITSLPNDIFLLIIAHLSPLDLIACRLVSHSFHSAFTDPDLSRHVLLQHYPRARELRSSPSSLSWAQTFARVASRYHHLQSGRPRRIEQFALGKSLVVPSWARHYPVAPWQRHLQFEEKSAPFQYADTLWTYDDGLLVFPSAEKQAYVIYDLAAGRFYEVEFGEEGNAGKIVRRIRLKDGVLVVEWCEGNAYHQLNENEMVYRHFATAYDVVHDADSREWRVVFR